MSKRRISKQQSARIQKIQKGFQDLGHDSLADGLVITRFSKHVEIEDSHGSHFICSIRPNLDTLVAGDRVVWQTDGKHQGVVVSVYPRASLLARPTSSGIKKPVAANSTQMIIVIAPEPEVSWPLLDSYLIMSELLHLHAVIVLNKTDLPCEAIKKRLLEEYKILEYPVLFCAKGNDSAMDDLKVLLSKQVNVFVGQSGVGKSSLISQILPHEEDIAIQEISSIAKLGKHTTSNSRYYHLESGGALIDSPGVREFSLWNVDRQLIGQGYKEFAPYLSTCKFRNCTHKDTPGCAILDAVDRGLISENRYQNFLKLCMQYGHD